MLPSDENRTCMNPVDDMYVVLGLTEPPDNTANVFAEEHNPVTGGEDEHS